jgi:predicted nucleic acid-binding protein
VTSAQIIDACVLINLLATEELKGILGTIKKSSLICSFVEKETLYLRTLDRQKPKDLIDLGGFVNDGLLRVCTIEDTNEESLYVDFASTLDDGEAMTLAIAIARDFDLVTDELKARRIFLDRVPHPKRLISTSQILRQWAELRRISATKLKNTLYKIETRARYRPPTSDYNYKWWVNSR